MILPVINPKRARMNQESFLDGKVTKQSLPIFQGKPPGDAPGAKRLILAQGELAQCYDDEQGIRYLACVELRAGGIRGNHFHRIKEEYVYVISGELSLVAQNGREGARVSVHCRAGDLAFIATGVAHALQTVTPGFAIEFSKTKFDPIDSEQFILL